ncbi:hypothetical protein BGW80DRAFT_1417224 [Lactifluus volemus]|nr:hypothetical protein BGW80DRAFT_1417224 [Lactifluus volemus]
MYLSLSTPCRAIPPDRRDHMGTLASEMKTRTIDDMDSRMGFSNFVMRHINEFMRPPLHSWSSPRSSMDCQQ